MRPTPSLQIQPVKVRSCVSCYGAREKSNKEGAVFASTRYESINRAISCSSRAKEPKDQYWMDEEAGWSNQEPTAGQEKKYERVIVSTTESSFIFWTDTTESSFFGQLPLTNLLTQTDAPARLNLDGLRFSDEQVDLDDGASEVQPKLTPTKSHPEVVAASLSGLGIARQNLVSVDKLKEGFFCTDGESPVSFQSVPSKKVIVGPAALDIGNERILPGSEILSDASRPVNLHQLPVPYPTVDTPLEEAIRPPSGDGRSGLTLTLEAPSDSRPVSIWDRLRSSIADKDALLAGLVQILGSRTLNRAQKIDGILGFLAASKKEISNSDLPKGLKKDLFLAVGSQGIGRKTRLAIGVLVVQRIAGNRGIRYSQKRVAGSKVAETLGLQFGGLIQSNLASYHRT